MYTLSAWIKGAAGVNMRIHVWEMDTGGGFLRTSLVYNFVGSTSWERHTATWTAGPNTALVTILILTNEVAATTYYVDGLQVEAGPIAHDYVETNGAAASAVQGTPDGSYGVWKPTTNLIANGGFETDSAGWSADGAEARSTAKAKFGFASLKCQTSGAENDTVGVYDIAAGFVAGDVLTYSIWVNPDITVTLNLQSNQYNAISTLLDFGEGAIVVCPAGVWTRLTHTRAVVSGVTRIQFYVTSWGVQPSTAVYLDGAQIEKSAIPTPYVETNGAPATRGIPTIYTPASVIDEKQSWFAMRVRMPWAYPTNVGENSFFFLWGDGVDHIYIAYTPNGQWHCLRDNDSLSDGVFPYTSWNVGDEITIIGAWQATEVGMSFNGGAFVKDTTIVAGIPEMHPTAMPQLGGSGWINGDILWFMIGLGKLTDSDAAMIHAFGKTNPKVADLPIASIPTLLWSADDINSVTTIVNPAIRIGIDAQKPAGLQYTYSVVPDFTYDDLDASAATYDALDAAHPTYDDMEG